MKGKRRTWKQGLSLLLAAVLLMGSMQFSVQAEEVSGNGITAGPVSENGTASATVSGNGAAAQEPGAGTGEETKITVSENSVSENAIVPVRRAASRTTGETTADLNTITFDAGEDGYLSQGEVKNVIAAANLPAGSKFTAVILEGVTSIGNSAFYDCSSLTSITLVFLIPHPAS